MKTKKYFVGAAVSLALLINPLQVSADNAEIFGDEFEDSGSEVLPFQNGNEDNADTFQDDNEDIGGVLIFNNPDNEKVEEKEIIVEPETRPADRERILPPSKNPSHVQNGTNRSLRQKSQRFVKVAMDDDFIYYLDKQSIEWKRLPYSASEYMLDFWIRMIERNPDTSGLSSESQEYLENGGVQGEIEVAADRGLAFTPSDVEVLNHRKFFLEHYYIRPKTKQIQFLCELEVIGHPQNTVSEREYAYKNWENLIPGSIESMIYQTTIKEVHRSRADIKGHMSVADMFDEYLRISIR